MADFKRNETDFWRREVPGARWFKADLQIHTIDDLPGGGIKIPPGVKAPCDNTAPWSEDALRDYARKFLQSATRNGIQVLGITPHSARMRSDSSLSAAWKIVEVWNEENDHDNIPFIEKIHAVFPGFEPSLQNGNEGLHMLLLFDPEIGRERYLNAYHDVMGHATPWRGGEFVISDKSAEDAFQALYRFHKRECPEGRGKASWSYIALAPHIGRNKGYIDALKGQVLENFPHKEVAGLDPGREKLPEDVLKKRKWLSEGMTKYRQAFFHSSDAYKVEDIGRRYTWIKLASPRIEALRQAFLAGDSRIRIAYERGENGKLIEISNPPNETAGGRPWLKSVEVKGEASFFGGGSGTRFDLSPDLTCVIGGSMTGKSTFLDGLRVHLGAPLPENDESLSKQIEGRGRIRFLGSDSADVPLKLEGGDPTAEHFDRWQAVFFSQNELQKLAQEPDAVEEVLARFAASEATEIKARDEQLRSMDDGLRCAASRLDEFDNQAAEVEQSCERCRGAVEKLEAFKDAGIEEYHRASRDLARWMDSAKASKKFAKAIDRVLQTAESIDMPDIDSALATLLRTAGVDEQAEAFSERWDRIADSLRAAKRELTDAAAVIESIANVLKTNEQNVQRGMNRTLADIGMDSSKIDEFQALSRQAALLESYEAALHEINETRRKEERAFEELLEKRNSLVEEQRAAFDQARKAIGEKFEGRISASRIDNGNLQPLDKFLRGLSKQGVTRWWNDQKDKHPPGTLMANLKAGDLGSVRMSGAVQDTFRETLTRSKRRELKAIRCKDRYLLKSRVGGNNYRPLDQLSGGKRVSLLLSLLLETDDNRPLVIDQPEDEIDNRFLFGTILPALKRLKGRRQIIMATHNANIVVNGDADQVIQLEADADRGWIAQSGAIEDPAVRKAIIQTVDGGDEAFRLRRKKYGF